MDAGPHQSSAASVNSPQVIRFYAARWSRGRSRRAARRPPAARGRGDTAPGAVWLKTDMAATWRQVCPRIAVELLPAGTSSRRSRIARPGGGQVGLAEARGVQGGAGGVEGLGAVVVAGHLIRLAARSGDPLRRPAQRADADFRGSHAVLVRRTESPSGWAAIQLALMGAAQVVKSTDGSQPVWPGGGRRTARTR